MFHRFMILVMLVAGLRSELLQGGRFRLMWATTAR